MAFTIGTNIGPLWASVAIASHQRGAETAMARLSSGSRLMSAADDPAGRHILLDVSVVVVDLVGLRLVGLRLALVVPGCSKCRMGDVAAASRQHPSLCLREHAVWLRGSS